MDNHAENFQMQIDAWILAARSIAATIPPLDFLAWHGVPYVVLKAQDDEGRIASVELKELQTRRILDCGRGVDLGGEDAAWLERKDAPMNYGRYGLYI